MDPKRLLLLHPHSQRRLGVVIKHLCFFPLSHHDHHHQEKKNYFKKIHTALPLAHYSGMNVSGFSSGRSFHQIQRNFTSGTTNLSHNIKQDYSAPQTSNLFKQYWESIHSFIQDGNKSLEESICALPGLNISNINKLEIPEDVAYKLAQLYMNKLDKNGKIRFFEVMVMHFGGIPISALLHMMRYDNNSDSMGHESENYSKILSQTIDKLRTSLQNVQLLSQNGEHVERHILGFLNSIQQLRTTIEPYYEKFLEQYILTLMKKEVPFNSQNLNGLEFVMQMRQDLLDIISTLQKQSNNINQDYKKYILPFLLNDLNTNLVRLLSSWFSPSFLECKELDWRQTNAQLLEKIISSERVHPIASMEVLKNRLAPTPNRKMYGLFHSSMPRVPLVVLQVALMDHIASNMREIHDVKKDLPQLVNTAIFYSISSTQSGLQGIELGNYLIKNVVGILQKKRLITDNFTGDINQFSTLSPIPGFIRWLSQKLRIECSQDEELKQKFHDEKLLSRSDMDLIKQIATEDPKLFGFQSLEEVRMKSGCELLLALVEFILSSPEATSLHPSDKLQSIMLRLCARYLYSEKHKSKALDPVANFHLRNGACLERINWKGDLSQRRLKESYGLMVNYKYVLELIDENHHDYVITGANKIRLGELFDKSLLE
ncbi:hypothetical protein FDP41_001984 [Naegleria fowleri]|uniref:Malonyl-CoA decarboxylase C-terminal domain-containing protein n=1 Tax=Naegleria fowleri TaxID=5763 RepID=A0A6A5BX71_NAEFO|nr:uncharacterized protein FDP41_001984 [Naegleria fowleri]KAF0978914.1 hypothetical protein FDP41_001984 [Naegleria fowleri]